MVVKVEAKRGQTAERFQEQFPCTLLLSASEPWISTCFGCSAARMQRIMSYPCSSKAFPYEHLEKPCAHLDQFCLSPTSIHNQPVDSIQMIKCGSQTHSSKYTIGYIYIYIYHVYIYIHTYIYIYIYVIIVELRTPAMP